MSYQLSPEEQKRIIEEQRLRNRENMKTGFKFVGTGFAIIGGIVILVLACTCLAVTGVLGSLF